MTDKTINTVSRQLSAIEDPATKSVLQTLIQNIDNLQYNVQQRLGVPINQVSDELRGYTGALGSYAFDTTLKVPVFFDGETLGGFPVLGATGYNFVSPMDPEWGAKFDGVTDDTAALQACITYCTENHKLMLWPAGDTVISDSLKIGATQNWDFMTLGRVIITQQTNNTPIFEFTGENTHSFSITGNWWLQWNTQQTSSHTNSIAFAFNYTASTGAGIYNFEVSNVRVHQGWRAIAHHPSASGQIPIWNCRFTRIWHTSAAGAAVWFVSPTTAGAPKCHLKDVYHGGGATFNDTYMFYAIAVKESEWSGLAWDATDKTAFIALSGCRITLIGLQAEGGEITTTGARMVYAANGTQLLAISPRITNTTLGSGITAYGFEGDGSGNTIDIIGAAYVEQGAGSGQLYLANITNGDYFYLRSYAYGGNALPYLGTDSDARSDALRVDKEYCARGRIDLHFYLNTVGGSASVDADAGGGANKGHILTRDCYVVGLAVNTDASRTAGTLTVQLKKNGTAFGPTVAIDGTNPDTVYTSRSLLEGYTAAAGDRITCDVTTSGFTPTSANIAVDAYLAA